MFQGNGVRMMIRLGHQEGHERFLWLSQQWRRLPKELSVRQSEAKGLSRLIVFPEQASFEAQVRVHLSLVPEVASFARGRERRISGITQDRR